MKTLFYSLVLGIFAIMFIDNIEPRKVHEISQEDYTESQTVKELEQKAIRIERENDSLVHLTQRNYTYFKMID